MSAPPYVDDVRVGLAEVLDLDAQPGASRRQEVGQEHVAVLGQLQQHLAGGRVLEGQADAPLAPVGVLHERLEGALGDTAGPDLQTTLGIAGHRVLHLDDVGPPVGQDGAGGRREGELGHFEDPNP